MRRNLVGAALGVVAAGAVLTACGGGVSSSSAATIGSTADSTAPSSADDGGSGPQTVEVKATEYAFGLSTTHFSPGTYTFVMKDDGHATHAIAISGPGVANKSSATSGPGGTASLTVTLQNGNYVLWCPIGNHRALGMQTKLSVG
jgi:plastocyanin